MRKHHQQYFAFPSQKRSLALFALVTIAVIIAGVFAPERQSVFASSELRFFETSDKGLQIVPASCPSSPHYQWECEGLPNTNPDIAVQCTFGANPSTIVSGESTTLYWVGRATTNYSGSINQGIGSVPSVGSRSVSPAQTTTYVYSMGGTSNGYDYFGATCQTTVTVGAACPNGLNQALYPSCSCPAGTAQQGSKCVLNCPAGANHPTGANCACPSGTTMQTTAEGFICAGGVVTPQPGDSCSLPNICSNATTVFNQCAGTSTNCATQYGTGWTCSAGACIPPANSAVDIRATPVLLRQGETTMVSWTATSVASCTVTEDNPDIVNTWTGLTGNKESDAIRQKTKFTLTCQGNSSNPGTHTDSVTVNILPVFEEQ